MLVSSVQELLLKVAASEEKNPLDLKAEDATLLEAATKQRTIHSFYKPTMSATNSVTEQIIWK
jgi:hypothetical protein